MYNIHIILLTLLSIVQLLIIYSNILLLYQVPTCIYILCYAHLYYNIQTIILINNPKILKIHFMKFNFFNFVEFIFILNFKSYSN